jgi:hypothetical protein
MPKETHMVHQPSDFMVSELRKTPFLSDLIRAVNAHAGLIEGIAKRGDLNRVATELETWAREQRDGARAQMIVGCTLSYLLGLTAGLFVDGLVQARAQSNERKH